MHFGGRAGHKKKGKQISVFVGKRLSKTLESDIAFIKNPIF